MKKLSVMASAILALLAGSTIMSLAQAEDLEIRKAYTQGCTRSMGRVRARRESGCHADPV